MTSTLTTLGSGDTALALRAWPPPGSPRASMLIVHGIAEHSGRYEHVGAFFTEAGLAVHAVDLPGFGHSGGRRAYVDSFDRYLDVVEERLAAIRLPDVPTVLYGHSMGGLIALAYCLSERPAPDLAVLSAPALDANVPTWQRKGAPLLGRLVPRLPVASPIDGDQLSHDPAVGEAYFADPLVVTSTTAALGAELFATMAATRGRIGRLTVPTYVFHGGADTLVPPQFSAPLQEVPVVTRRLWPTLRHEAHNEPEYREVLGEVLGWLDAQLVAD